jgi:N-acetyltransferase
MILPQILILKGQLCTLTNLMPVHLPQLAQIAADPAIWQHLPIRGWQSDIFWAWAEETMVQKADGLIYPFVIIDNATHEVVGTTRFQDLYLAHRKMDIGWTWFDPSVWGTGINTEAKMLMLHYAFDKCGVVRIGFKVDENNLRSQRALEKLGAYREGIFRKHLIRPDGTYRTSYFYSITDDDWARIIKNKTQAFEQYPKHYNNALNLSTLTTF